MLYSDLYFCKTILATMWEYTGEEQEWKQEEQIEGSFSNPGKRQGLLHQGGGAGDGNTRLDARYFHEAG